MNPILESDRDLFWLADVLGYEYGMLPDGRLGVWPGPYKSEEPEASVKELFNRNNPESLGNLPKANIRERSKHDSWSSRREPTLEDYRRLRKAERMRMSGMTFEQIGKYFGVSRTTVHKVLIKGGSPVCLQKRPL